MYIEIPDIQLPRVTRFSLTNYQPQRCIFREKIPIDDNKGIFVINLDPFRFACFFDLPNQKQLKKSYVITNFDVGQSSRPQRHINQCLGKWARPKVEIQSKFVLVLMVHLNSLPCVTHFTLINNQPQRFYTYGKKFQSTIMKGFL